MSTTDIDTIMAEMRAALEGVTPGEWKARVHAESTKPDAVVANGRFVARCQPLFGRPHHHDEACENARHIAACSPDRIAALLAEVERLQVGRDMGNLWAKEKERADAAEARLAEAVEVVRTLLEAYSAYFKPGNPWADKVRETLGIEAPETHDTTNPFAPRERPKKSFRLMTDDERRAAGLDPNGGFDGPTGAD